MDEIEPVRSADSSLRVELQITATAKRATRGKYFDTIFSFLLQSKMPDKVTTIHVISRVFLHDMKTVLKGCSQHT